MSTNQSNRRVVVTGMGWITPLGHDIDGVWKRLLNAESGMGPTTRFDARTFPTNFCAEVRDYSIDRFVKDASVHASAGLNSQFALGAACQAWKQSGLEGFGGLDRKRVGLYLGAGEGVLDFDNYAAANLAGWNAADRKVDGVSWAGTAHQVLERMCEVEQEPNMPLAHLAREFGIRGPALNCLTACAASTQAIGEAYSLIQRGDADVMISGGTHTMIHVLGVTGFNRLTALSTSKGDPTKASRPFDATRDGFVMGEGSGMIVLESLEHALARGATPLAEVGGYGSSADAFRITDIHPEGRGGAASMHMALAQAGIDPLARRTDGRAAIDYISAHGTGTKENDSIETRGVKRVFG
ncbi:MAG: putative 3-oxoacyl-[acyl-carrier-protein] synthase [Planctomycetota bacterium]